MAKTIVRTCLMCGGPASDRWKVRPGRYICDSCYQKLFKTKTIAITGEKTNGDNKGNAGPAR